MYERLLGKPKAEVAYSKEKLESGYFGVHIIGKLKVYQSTRIIAEYGVRTSYFQHPYGILNLYVFEISILGFARNVEKHK